MQKSTVRNEERTNKLKRMFTVDGVQERCLAFRVLVFGGPIANVVAGLRTTNELGVSVGLIRLQNGHKEVIPKVVFIGSGAVTKINVLTIPVG